MALSPLFFTCDSPGHKCHKRHNHACIGFPPVSNLSDMPSSHVTNVHNVLNLAGLQPLYLTFMEI